MLALVIPSNATGFLRSSRWNSTVLIVGLDVNMFSPLNSLFIALPPRVLELFVFSKLSLIKVVTSAPMFLIW